MPKLVIIEDENSIRLNLKILFEIYGYNVNAFDNGAEGLEHILNNDVDIILCDINMENMNGYEVLKVIRSNPKTKVIPFIFLTAKLDLDDIRLGMDLGADDYIHKPYTNEIVLNAVKSRLKKHNLVRNYVDEKVDNAKKKLVSSIPKDLKSPLMIINTYSDKLTNEADSIGKDEIIEIAGIIKQSSQKLNNLFENFSFYFELFDFSPDSENSITFNPNIIIQDLSEKIFKETNKSYEINLDENNYFLQINAHHFKKVVEVIIETSIKCSDDINKILIKTYNINHNYVFEVSNSAIEKDENNLQLGAFKRFNRALDKQKDVGLGLGIVKKVMDIYNFDFNIQNINGYSKSTLYFKNK